MDAWNVVECRAKEALGTLSLIDNNNNWEAPYEKPPKLLTRRVLIDLRSKSGLGNKILARIRIVSRIARYDANDINAVHPIEHLPHQAAKQARSLTS